MKFKNSTFAMMVAGFFIYIFASGCTSGKAALHNTSTEKSLLWEINIPGVKEPSYLFGTIHIIDAEDFFLPNGTMTAFEKSNKIFFEIDMAQMSDMSSMMGLMNKLYMSDGKTLKSLLSEKDYKDVANFFQKKGLPVIFFERMKPMFLTVLTYGDLNPGDLGNGEMKSYEFEFMEMANQTKKPTGGLESIEFQIGIFDKIPYEKQAQMLVDAINTNTGSGTELEEMVKVYLDQDIQKLASMIESPDSEISGYEDILLTERNNNWIPIIIEETKKQPSFFAVGAGHLGGKDGVISLLKKQGVKVKAILK
jgi:uncharacterized protein YbaP (TraB family)